jgi:NAD(P)-dependent dehydrogenase (short-subunit alcohol dehydrogenase family)
MAVPTLGPYCVTKHGVVALAETLFLELQGTGVGVSVLCPGLVKTGIFASERNRPERFGGSDHEADDLQQLMQGMLAGSGTEPAEVAELVLDAVKTGRFWLLPHPELGEMVSQRAAAITGGTQPGGLDLGID